jgi:hypothetical protein
MGTQNISDFLPVQTNRSSGFAVHFQKMVPKSVGPSDSFDQTIGYLSIKGKQSIK